MGEFKGIFSISVNGVKLFISNNGTKDKEGDTNNGIQYNVQEKR